MKQTAKILICYNSPVSVFSVYNGKRDDENAMTNDLSENNFVRELEKVEHSLLKNFTEVKSLAVDRTCNR